MFLEFGVSTQQPIIENEAMLHCRMHMTAVNILRQKHVTVEVFFGLSKLHHRDWHAIKTEFSDLLVTNTNMPRHYKKITRGYRLAWRHITHPSSRLLFNF